ncbi:MAG: ribonuclease M5 [Firmicutes bacterium]|nr:ribonuclease M5 [Bacillota bacterium]
MFKEVIVVEGIHDMQRLQSIYPEIECIITGGSEISNNSLDIIQKVSLNRGVILFLDPDFPGKQITNKIVARKGNYKIAFLAQAKAISKNKKKVGIEHASTADIKESLDHLFSIQYQIENTVTLEDLMQRKLVNYPESAMKRQMICNVLNLPICNGKTFLKLTKMLNISISQIDEVIK